jgi:hypothetical protein
MEPTTRAEDVELFWPMGGPLVERLSAESLAALASVTGETVAELVARVCA